MRLELRWQTRMENLKQEEMRPQEHKEGSDTAHGNIQQQFDKHKTKDHALK